MLKLFTLTDDVVETARFTLSGICGFEITTQTARKALESAQRVAPPLPPRSGSGVTAEEHNAAFDPANDALGGAFKDGFREGWLFASDPGFDNREELEGDYHHVVDIAPAECWDAYREKYFAMLPLAAIPAAASEGSKDD